MFEGVSNSEQSFITKSNITQFSRFYRKEHPDIKDFQSTGDTLTIRFKGTYTPERFGIQLTVTAFISKSILLLEIREIYLYLP